MLISMNLSALTMDGTIAQLSAADEWETFAKAPSNHSLLSNSLNGWYFVPKDLKKQYDDTMQRLEALQTSVDGGHVTVKEATAELASLKTQLQAMRTQLEKNRVHVEGAAIHEQTETIEFEPAPEKRLAITANDVRVVGWPGPKIKVELKKLVLSSDGTSVDEQLKAISIVHQRGKVEFAGQTDDEWDSQEAEFLANDGAKLNKQQLEERRQFVDGIRGSYAHHRDLLGKDIDHLTVKGLEYDQNGHVQMRVKSEGGDGQAGSVRQRYAELTVYVPESTSVCIRGARRGLLVENLTAELTIVDEDSTDTGRGRFEVRGLKGDLLCKDFPLQVIAGVRGHVAITSMTEFGVYAGLSYRNGLQNMTPGRPFSVTLQDVTEGVRLRYGRVRLNLQDISGTIDVWNEFGDTHFSATAPLASSAHRIVSQSGRIDAELSEDAWESTPVIAVTNYGGVQTNIPREEFEDFHLSGQHKPKDLRRNWSGFRTVVEGKDRFAIHQLIHRFDAILEARERSSGLDLLTRNGRVVVLRK